LGRASRAETAPERVSENHHYRKLEQNQTLTSRRFGYPFNVWRSKRKYPAVPLVYLGTIQT
jgi:hypothetical protein